MNIDQETDIIFVPNRSSRGRLDEFKMEARRGTLNWASKKAPRNQDLHLFYFGKPALQVVGFGICSGQFDDLEMYATYSGRRRRKWLAVYPKAVVFSDPIRIDQIKADRILKAWWLSLKYEGPRSLKERPTTARRLLQLIIHRNPTTQETLSKYLALVSSKEGYREKTPRITAEEYRRREVAYRLGHVAKFCNFTDYATAVKWIKREPFSAAFLRGEPRYRSDGLEYWHDDAHYALTGLRNGGPLVPSVLRHVRRDGAGEPCIMRGI